MVLENEKKYLHKVVKTDESSANTSPRRTVRLIVCSLVVHSTDFASHIQRYIPYILTKKQQKRNP